MRKILLDNKVVVDQNSNIPEQPMKGMYVKEIFKWIKYCCIITKSLVTGRTVITFCGTSYAIAGNTVRKLGGRQ